MTSNSNVCFNIPSKLIIRSSIGCSFRTTHQLINESAKGFINNFTFLPIFVVDECDRVFWGSGRSITYCSWNISRNSLIRFIRDISQIAPNSTVTNHPALLKIAIVLVI